MLLTGFSAESGLSGADLWKPTLEAISGVPSLEDIGARWAFREFGARGGAILSHFVVDSIVSSRHPLAARLHYQ